MQSRRVSIKDANQPMLPSPRKSPNIPRNNFCWPILVLICSCATGRTADHVPQPAVPPPDYLVCNRDADCEIAQVHCGADSEPSEPYAISRAASERLKPWSDCEPVEIEILYLGPCHTNPEDWTAACSGHVCKRQKAHFFSSPEVHCPRQ
jgi:hypothetical protein